MALVIPAAVRLARIAMMVIVMSSSIKVNALEAGSRCVFINRFYLKCQWQVNTAFSPLIHLWKQRTASLPVNKPAVLDQLLSVLNAELAALTRAAQGAFAAATDPDSKAENKYDTRTLEASYVARGQAQRVAELQEAVRAFGALSGNTLDSGAAITLGALVTLETPGEQTHYFLGPFAGGTEIVHAGQEVVVITPASALGQKLITKRAGDTIALRPGLSAKVTAVA